MRFKHGVLCSTNRREYETLQRFKYNVLNNYDGSWLDDIPIKTLSDNGITAQDVIFLVAMSHRPNVVRIFEDADDTVSVEVEYEVPDEEPMEEPVGTPSNAEIMYIAALMKRKFRKAGRIRRLAARHRNYFATLKPTVRVNVEVIHEKKGSVAATLEFDLRTGRVSGKSGKESIA